MAAVAHVCPGSDVGAPYHGSVMILRLIVLIVILVVIVRRWCCTSIATYNGLVTLRNRVENAWAQIDVQLKRRHDLIPNLVETVKGYAAHERETLDAVVQARNAAIAAPTPRGRRPRPRTC